MSILYRGFKIAKVTVTAGYEPRVSVSRPVPFAVYRTYPDTETAKLEIDKLLDKVTKFPKGR